MFVCVCVFLVSSLVGRDFSLPSPGSSKYLVNMIRIISYNVLSPELSEPETFPENTAEECDGERRLPRILEMIEIEIKNSSIISLQEVSISWLGALHELFDRHNYHYTHTLYGGWYSGYMGVGVAFPRSLYSLSKFEISKISDTKKWPRLSEKKSSGSGGGTTTIMDFESVLARSWNYSTTYVRNVFDPLFLLGSLAFGSSSSTSTSSSSSSKGGTAKQDSKATTTLTPDEQQEKNAIETFYQSKRRSNQAILLRLQRKSDGTIFCVANYHNPCAIHLRPIITFHAAMYVQKAQQFAESYPLIVCGDFNMTPDSGGYQLVTTAQLDTSHPEYPLLPDLDPWRPTLRAMSSAYWVSNGQEPETTNKAVRLIGSWGGTEPNAFSGTLDYIFFDSKRGLSVVDTLSLPSKEDQTPISWPTLSIPSDHLMIGATFQLLNGGEEGESKI